MISLARFASSAAISFVRDGRSLQKAFMLPMVLGLEAFACGQWQIAAAQTKPATTTTLAVTSGTSSSPVTTVSSGSVVTLMATVTSGSTPLTVGQVSFCDAAAKACTDIHLLGLAQLTSAGTAMMRFRPGRGSHQYKAVFAGTTKYAGSASAAASLSVTGPTPTTTLLSQTGTTGSYSLTATVYGNGSAAPTGDASFLNSSNANAVLGSATLGNAVAGFNLLMPFGYGELGFGPMAVGDFNGDGILDVVVSAFAAPSWSVFILLGKEDGSFNVSPVTVSSTSLGDVAAGDFNGDGKLDLAVANDVTNTVLILLGNGDGTFTPSASSPATGTNSALIAVADFNGDGIPDLVVANQQSNQITILLGNGDGTFTPTAASVPTGPAPYSLAAADFNGDGIPDLAVLNNPNPNATGTLTVFLGNGDGTFTVVTKGPGTGTQADYIATSDFNGDGIADLAIAVAPTVGSSTGTVSVLTGNGDGTFNVGSPTSLPMLYGQNSTFLQKGDFNGDGKADLVMQTIGGPTNPFYGLTVLLGDGAGRLSPQPPVVITEYANPPIFSAITGDWNGDGVDDIIAVTPVGHGYVIALLSENQSATATVNGIALRPATGTAQVVASYAGDTHYQPSISPATTLTAAQGSPQVKVTASSNPASFGTSETLAASVTGSGLTPTGSVTFYDGAGQLGTQSLTNGAATFATASFAVGSHSITVSYGGDSNYTASTSPPLSLVVQKGPPAIGITPASSSILNTQALSVAIAVSGAAGSQIPQGTVVLSGGGYTSAAATLSSGTATINVPAGSLATGNDTLTVTYAPSSASAGSYTSATQTATVTVVKMGSGAANVTVSPSASDITDLQMINVSVTVAGGQGMATPTGSVQLASGAFSPQMALSSGAATFAIPAGTLGAGADTLTAAYSGDATYAGASGTATVTVSPVVMGATAPSPVAPGASATATVTLSAGSSYSGTLNLSCTLTTSPANAQSPPTCALNPSTATIAAGGNATTTLTVITTAGMSAMLMRSNDRLWARGTEAAAFAALLMIGPRARRRRWVSILALLVTAICVVSGGCGGSHSTPKSTPGTTAGTYVFTVKAVDSKDATIATSANVSVTVQ